jgi:hypothetical protein
MIKTLIGVIGFLALVLTCEAAPAATYVVRSCVDSPSGDEHSAGWSKAPQTTDVGATITLSCAAGGPAFSAGSGASHPRGAALGIQWVAAPNTTVVGASWDQSVYVPAAAPSWAWVIKVDGIDATTGDRFSFAQCFDSSTGCAQWTKYDGQSVNVTGGRKVSRMLVAAECDNYWPQACPASPTPRFSLTGASFLVEDVSPPIFVAPPSGTLLSTAPIAGLASVAFAAADKGGGLREASLEVDGAIVARTPLDEGTRRCIPPFVDPAPCPLAARRVLTLDTTTLADGAHRIGLNVVDATGSNKATFGPWTVSTRNGSPSTGSGTGAVPTCSNGGRGFSRWTLSSRVVRPGKLVTISGRLAKNLRSRAHDVLVFSQSENLALRAISPDKRGVFRARLRMTSSQQLRAAARTSENDVIGCSRSSRVRVRAQISIARSRHELRNGKSLELSGDVRADSRGAGGVIVRLKVRAASSHRWFSAGEVRADSNGRWQWRHRFTRTTQPTKYVFRAVVPQQRGHAFATGRSRSVHIVVRP